MGEGQGEREALPDLVGKLRSQLHLEALPYPSEKRTSRSVLTNRLRVEAACEQLRALDSCRAVMLTRDADNDHLAHADCPKYSAPVMAEWVRARELPFPVAVVLFYKEYETLFIAGAAGMAGRPVRDRRGGVVDTIPADAQAPPDPEYPRGAKEWVSKHLLPGYKPTLHQSAMTKALDLDSPELSALSSYRRLVSALRFLEANLDVAGAVYPPSQEGVAEDG